MERERVERLLRITLRNCIKQMNQEGTPIEEKELYIKGFTDCMLKVIEALKMEA